MVMVSAGAYSPASGHSGGLNAEGCHTNRKTGQYHCHRKNKRSTATVGSSFAPAMNLYGTGAGMPFSNCAAARAAGAAPVRIGEAGYSPRLDRDGDGIGCE